MKFLSHAGIALASSIASAFNAIFLYKYLKEYKFDFWKYGYFFLKIIISSVIMMLSLLAMKYINVNVLVNVFVCIIVYFLTLKIFKINIRGFKV